jgi:hypothetical protein
MTDAHAHIPPPVRIIPFARQTVRYSVREQVRAVRPPVAPAGHAQPPFVLYAGGRAHRVLAHLTTGVFPIARLVRDTNPGTYSAKRERVRVDRLCWVMARAGLVERLPHAGWTATAAGRAALADLQADIDDAAAPSSPVQGAH